MQFSIVTSSENSSNDRQTVQTVQTVQTSELYDLVVDCVTIYIYAITMFLLTISVNKLIKRITKSEK